jgi:hypothetical protein
MNTALRVQANPLFHYIYEYMDHQLDFYICQECGLRLDFYLNHPKIRKNLFFRYCLYSKGGNPNHRWIVDPNITFREVKDR